MRGRESLVFSLSLTLEGQSSRTLDTTKTEDDENTNTEAMAPRSTKVPQPTSSRSGRRPSLHSPVRGVPWVIIRPSVFCSPQSEPLLATVPSQGPSPVSRPFPDLRPRVKPFASLGRSAPPARPLSLPGRRSGQLGPDRGGRRGRRAGGAGGSPADEPRSERGGHVTSGPAGPRRLPDGPGARPLTRAGAITRQRGGRPSTTGAQLGPDASYA